MVSALSRKEYNQTFTIPVKPPTAHLWQWTQATQSKDNFPYALREFINSRSNLPTFDEIIARTSHSLGTCGQRI